MTWRNAFDRVGLTPADVRMWRVVLSMPPAPLVLLPVSETILRCAPERFRHGSVYSTRELAECVHYSRTHVQRGLAQLATAGYVLTSAPDRAGRVSYRGNPAKLLPQYKPRKAA